MAAYWKAVGAYAEHIRRVVRPKAASTGPVEAFDLKALAERTVTHMIGMEPRQGSDYVADVLRSLEVAFNEGRRA